MSKRLFQDYISRFTNKEVLPGSTLDASVKDILLSVNTSEFAGCFKETAVKSIVKNTQTMFEYKGMDIWVILQKYMQKAQKDPNAFENLITMIVLLCERGTNFDKFKSKMSAAGKETVENLANLYDLVSKISKDQANQLTLARIGHAFPMYVCQYMEYCKSPTVQYSIMESNWAKSYPKCMMASAFTALIPANDISGFDSDHRYVLTQAYLCHQIEFSKIVMKRSDHPKTMAECVDLTLPYATAGIDAEYLSDEQRLKYLEILGVWDKSGKPGIAMDSIIAAAGKLDSLL